MARDRHRCRVAISWRNGRNHTVRYRWLSVGRTEGTLYGRHYVRTRRCMRHGRWRHRVLSAIRRGTKGARWYGVVGRGRVRARVHGVIRRRILRRRRWSLHVRALWVSKHARGTIPARGIVSARDHASYFRGREVPQTIRVLIGWHGWGRDVVRNRTIWHHGRRYGHGRIVVGTRRRRVEAGGGRIDVAGIMRLLVLRVRRLGLYCRRLPHFVLGRRQQVENHWVRGVGLGRPLAGAVRGIGTYEKCGTISPTAQKTKWRSRRTRTFVKEDSYDLYVSVFHGLDERSDAGEIL